MSEQTWLVSAGFGRGKVRMTEAEIRAEFRRQNEAAKERDVAEGRYTREWADAADYCFSLRSAPTEVHDRECRLHGPGGLDGQP